MKNLNFILSSLLVSTFSLYHSQEFKYLDGVRVDIVKEELNIHKCLIKNNYGYNGEKFTENSFLDTATSIKEFRKDKGITDEKMFPNEWISLKYNNQIFINENNGYEEIVKGKIVFITFKEKFPKCYTKH